MRHQEIREKNKQKILEIALKYFVEYGIEKTKVKEVAKSAGLTERSAFRYFPTKADLVLEAAIYFWENTVEESRQIWKKIEFDNKPALEEIEDILTAYAFIFFERKKEMVFIQEAELYLYRLDMLDHFKNKPASSYKEGKCPLARAIRKGVDCGEIEDTEELELFYLNCFDSLLGLLQKLSTATYETELAEEQQKARISYFCDTLIKALKK